MLQSAPFSTQQAVELGRFVLSAYDLYTTPGSLQLPAGYTLVSYIYADDITDKDPDYFVFGFIARSGSDMVVAIRGTDGILEWIRNFEFALEKFPYVNAGKIEDGFNQFYSTLRTGADSTFPRVITVLTSLVADGSVTSLRITGHSLGGALATLLAIDVAGNNVFTQPVVYTFASPRVGDKVFAGTYDSLVATSWRIANVNDIVPQLPPQFVGYIHVDALFPINSDDHCKQNFYCWHSIDTYLNTLDTSVPLLPSCVPGSSSSSP